MKLQGTARVSDFLDDFVVYRRLEPADSRLPGLTALAADLGLAAGTPPRKNEREYARVIACILDAARALEGGSLREILYIGDSPLDGQAFANLLGERDWQGWAFIGRDTRSEEPALKMDGQVCFSNRWANLPGFLEMARRSGFHLDSSSAVVVDLDKTLLGPRGRNDATIDDARSQAAIRVAQHVLRDATAHTEFSRVYREMNQPKYHFFTGDNQDYLVYSALAIAAGVCSLSALLDDLAAHRLGDFPDFVALVGRELVSGAAPALAAIHAEVSANLQDADPTPFKSFRREEYLTTVGRMGAGTPDVELRDLLREKITLNYEVAQFLRHVRQRGALVLSLSDKPDEAVFPTAELAAQGYRPLHHVETVMVGEELNLA